MPYWIDWITHFENETPENRKAIKAALSIILADDMIAKYFDELKSVDAILCSVRILKEDK